MKRRVTRDGDEKTGSWLLRVRETSPADDDATMAEYKSKSTTPSFLPLLLPAASRPSIFHPLFNPFYFFLSSSYSFRLFCCPVPHVPVNHNNRATLFPPLTSLPCSSSALPPPPPPPLPLTRVYTYVNVHFSSCRPHESATFPI